MLTGARYVEDSGGDPWGWQVAVVDWLQLVSLVIVATALMLNVLQIRHLARQTEETSRQASAATTALRQAAYQSILAGQTNIVSLYLHSPSMIEWHLASRGYPVGSEEENWRSISTLIRLNSHESTYLAYAAGLLDEDIWSGWVNVMTTDFAVPEFVTLWPLAKRFYARSFATFVDAEVVGRA